MPHYRARPVAYSIHSGFECQPTCIFAFVKNIPKKNKKKKQNEEHKPSHLFYRFVVWTFVNRVRITIGKLQWILLLFLVHYNNKIQFD